MNIQQVQTIIADAMEKHNGIVKKEELTRLGIDYRRIDKLVRDGKLVRIRNGYYTDRVDDFSEDALVAALFPDAMLCLEYVRSASFFMLYKANREKKLLCFIIQ